MTLRNAILSTFCSLFLIGAAHAEQKESSHQKTLVELYTSQACGLCPKANRQFSEFAQSADVIALTFPVGYWDYLGWKDTFAEPEFGARQKAYNEAMGRRGPYTPQVIFHGADHCSATREKSMSRKAERARKKAAPLSISVDYDGDAATLSQPLDDVADIWVVEFVPGETFTTPSGGANRKKEMVYYNRVVGISHVTIAPREMRIEAPCASSCVAIVQQSGHGEVLGAGIFQAAVIN